MTSGSAGRASLYDAEFDSSHINDSAVSLSSNSDNRYSVWLTGSSVGAIGLLFGDSDCTVHRSVMALSTVRHVFTSR